MKFNKMLNSMSLSPLVCKSFRILENRRSNRISEKCMISKFKKMFRFGV